MDISEVQFYCTEVQDAPACVHGSRDQEASTNEERFMRAAIEEARAAAEEGEVPVGCVLVDDSLTIVGRGRNATNRKKDATRHCEFEAIDDFIQKQFGAQCGSAPPYLCIPTDGVTKGEIRNRSQNIDEAFRKLDLYVTCEPCVMCSMAIRFCGIRRVFFGCKNGRFGGCGSVLSLHTAPLKDLPPIICKGGIFASEAVALLRAFYSRGNPNAPTSKRQRPLEDIQGCTTHGES